MSKQKARQRQTRHKSIAIRDEAPRAPFSIEHSRDCASSTGHWHICSHKRAYTWPSFDHRVCIAVCTCTPRLSSTLYSLLGLYLSVFLVVILMHPRLCTVTVVAPYLAVYFRCGLEACGVCLWRGHVCAHVPGSSDALTCGAIQAGPGHAHVPSLSDALTCGAIQAGPGHAHVPGTSDTLTCVGRLRQALAMHMAVGQSKHSNINCRGVWRLVSRHQLSVETACIHALIYMPGGMRLSHAHAHSFSGRPCTPLSLGPHLSCPPHF